MICVVQRQFPGPDGMLAVGTRVNTSEWRPMNVESLLRNRFLQPIALSEETPAPPKAHITTKVKKTKRVIPRDDDDE